MDPIIYHNPRCGKSRNTLKILEEKGLKPDVRLYLKQAPTNEELTDLVKKLGISPLELVRKGESIYKENYKGKQLTDKQWIEAMVANPILIERPIVVVEDKAVLGRPPENVLEII